ncbi:hypothetical protein P692DRAFT_20881370 [Suillus brevipes Sb2]|nr:hypothetical protein P692DRAFT_20881370 [Suillus brevipes Sb2]
MSQTTSAPSTVAVPMSDSARQKRKITDLERSCKCLNWGRQSKEDMNAFIVGDTLTIAREVNYIMSQGRAIRQTITLFDSIEELIGENDRWCNDDNDNTVDQNHLQSGYIALNNALPWFHQKALNMEHNNYFTMLKKLKSNPPVDPEDKFCRGFTNNTCSKLLCPTEPDWNDPIVRAGIRDHMDGYVVTEMSWPAFLYAGYTADQNNLEEGLFKSKLLIQAFKAIFTSPFSTKKNFLGRKSKHMWHKLSRSTKSQPT